MAFGLIIIGDEILSGKRIDKHFPKIVSLLKARGLSLAWAEYVGDDRPRLTSLFRRSLSTTDIVFCCGGIGATPDDHTRQCVAAALGVPLELHPDSKQKIQERMMDIAREKKLPLDLNRPDNLHRLKMGEFPLGAQIIPNRYNKIPGFSIEHGDGGAHYFVPGFPVMAWPMIEWVLDTQYSHLFHQQALAEKSLLVFETMESTLTPLMETIEEKFSKIKVFSLPHVGDAQTRRHIELGVKGDTEQVELAFDALVAGLWSLQVEIQAVGENHA